MNKEWTYSLMDSICGRKALHHKETRELSLGGKYGEVYIYSDSLLAARIVSHKVANKLARHYNKEPNNHLGDESVIKFPYADINFVAKTLMIPKSQKTQLKYMESVLK